MNNFTNLRFVLLVLAALNLCYANSQSVYFETYDLPDGWGGGSAGSYTAKSYVNPADPQGDQFSSNDAIREATNVLTGYAWRLRNAGIPYFLYECGEYVAGFSVFMAHWNPSIALDVTIEYSINSGLSFELIASLDETWWSSQGLGEKEYQQFYSGDLNIVPVSGEKIYLRIMTDGNERLLIDDFQLLYNNGSAGVQDPLEFSATPASDSQISLVFVPNNANDDVVIVFDADGSFDDPSGELPAAGLPFAGGTLFYSGIESPQIHSGLIPGQTVFYKAWSYDGTDFSTGLQAQASTPGTNASPNAWINEIHYDNDGSDIDEFIEIVVEHPELYTLHDFSVSLYNGSTGEVYASETADNFEQGETISEYTIYTWFFSGIQNGAPEGIALAMNDQLVNGQFLSYEGTFTGTNGPATGVLSDDIGVQEPTTTPVGYSLQLEGSGLVYGHFSWAEPADDTPGSLNNMQEIGNFTAWTGAVNNDWHLEGNWDNGVPTPTLNAIVADVSPGASVTPSITGIAEVANLVIEQGSSLEIEVNGAFTVNGSFTNHGIVDIRSDASGSGSLIESTGILANVEQYIVPDQWHYISSPVTDLYSDVFEGMFLMNWDEPSETWTFIDELGVPLNTGLQGYGVWSETATAVGFSGLLNTGPFSIEVSNTEGTFNPENDPSGYNLVGNPYPSALDWDIEDGAGWTRSLTQVALSVYFWNGTQYASYVKGGPNPGPNGGTNIIPPHQGFFIKCLSSEGGSISVDDNARVHSNHNFYKDSEEVTESIKLRLNGNELSDELVIYIHESSTFDFDPLFDAGKLYGSEEAPQLYAYAVDHSKLSINGIPGLENDLTIPLGFKTGVAGIYELILEEINGLEDVPLYLEDLYEFAIVDLKQEDAYKFSTAQGDFEDRFVLYFDEDEIPVYQKSPDFETLMVFVRDRKVIVDFNKSSCGHVFMSDLCGRKIISDSFSDSMHLEFDLSSHHGWYIVRVVTQTGTQTRRIYIAG